MLSEDFDKKILEAADHHHPAYDEQAWKKMRRLLDKHLPEKGRRRRGLILLLLFLVAGGGIVLVTQLRKGETAVAEQKSDNSTRSQPVTPVDASKTVPTEQQIMLPVRTEPQPGIYQNNGGMNPRKFWPGSDDLPIVETRLEPLMTQPEEFDLRRFRSGNELIDAASLTASNIGSLANRVRPGFVYSGTSMALPASRKKSTVASGFALSISAGPDVSATRLSAPGQVKLLGGAGISYTYKDRLTLSTGFYSGRKVYSARAEDYSPPPAFWIYYPSLDRVDADCKVYEIPVSLSYRFASSGRGNWFAGAGASSYLMKKETYNYHYKDLYGRPASRQWTIRDQNKHYFSVLTLSGGYQRQLNRHFSVSAEPYLKLPLAGVGYGKVKLNSAGLMVSASFRPFAKGPR